MFVTKYNLMSTDNLIVPILEEQQTENESEAWQQANDSDNLEWI